MISSRSRSGDIQAGAVTVVSQDRPAGAGTAPDAPLRVVRMGSALRVPGPGGLAEAEAVAHHGRRVGGGWAVGTGPVM